MDPFIVSRRVFDGLVAQDFATPFILGDFEYAEIGDTTFVTYARTHQDAA